MSNVSMSRNVLRDRGAFISVSQHDTSGTIDHIPAHVYDVGFHPEMGLLLVKDRKQFTVPERKYGEHRVWFNAVTSRYDRLNPSMGVLMVGLKGSGKSMLAEDICNWGLAQDLPVLFINQKLPVHMIHGAVSSIGPCIVYFDEFGKSYRASDDQTEENERDKMITLFSDSSHRGVMFIVTGNAQYEFSDFMIDRPGRFEFRLNFGKLSVKAAADIADEFKLNPDMRDILLRHTVHNNSSYDIATKLAASLRGCKSVEEAATLLSILNVPPIAWYMYVIREVLYNGERVSNKLTSVHMVEDNSVNLIIRNDVYEELENVTIDLMNPVAALIGEEERNTSDYLPVGKYKLKVSEHLTLIFNRSLHGHRRSVHCTATSVADDEEQARQHEERMTNVAAEGQRHSRSRGGVLGLSKAVADVSYQRDITASR